jgi:hypothetical protein
MFNVVVAQCSVNHADLFGTERIAFIVGGGVCVLFPRMFSFAFNPLNDILASTYMSEDRDTSDDGSTFGAV